MIKYILLVILCLFILKTYSQNISDIKLDILLCCNLHDVLSDISDKYPVKFKYDIDRLKNIKYNSRPFNKPLNLFLDQVCEKAKLKFYISEEDSVIHIVDRWFNSNQQIAKDNKKYTGEPTKFNFKLTGKVIEKGTAESLPYVTVIVKGTTNGTATNLDGLFTLLNVPTDTSTIILQYLGYRTKAYYLTPDMKGELIFEMEQDNISLNEVSIVAERQDILKVSNLQTSMIKMSPVKLNTLPNLGEKDILRSFQLMPGISAANENSSGLYIRGGTPDQVLVQYDGFTVYNVEHLFGFFSAFNSNAIKDVQLYKGGFDAKYGGRLSGVVEITGKDGNQNELNGCFDLSLMSVNGLIEFPIGNKTTVILAGRKSWKSPVYKKIFEQFTDENETSEMGRRGPSGFGGQSTSQETRSYFYDLNTKITYRPTDKDVISLSFYNGMDDLDNSIIPQSNSGFGGQSFNMNIKTVDLTKWGNTGASIKWSHVFSDKLYSNSILSYSNYYSLRERSTSGSFQRGNDGASSISRGVNEDNNLNDFTVKTGFEYLLSDKNQIEFGIQTTYNQIDYEYLQNDTTKIIDRNLKGQTLSFYLQDKLFFLKKKLLLKPGIRYNYYSVTDKFYFEPRLNMVYMLNDNFKLKAAAGNYYQFAKRVIREDITEGSRDFWVLSDGNLLPVSSSLQYIAGLSYETSKFIFDVEGFFKELKNVTEYSLRIEPNMSRGPEAQTLDYSENFFTGTGIVKGIDFLLQKKSGVMTGWLGYTISEATNNIPEYGDYDFYASQDVTHEFKVVFTYKYKKWNFGANWIYTTGRPYTAPEGGYQLTLLDGNTADYINVSVKNGNRLPDYHRLDLSATYNFKLGGKSPMSLGFSLFNVYNHANVWYKEYEIIDNEVIETPVYYLGITPNISLTIKIK